MEKFGMLEYDEANKFRVKAKDKIPTDAVVLRGWYTNISVAVYGKQTEVTTLKTITDKLKQQASPSAIVSPKDKLKSPSPMVVQSDTTKPIVVDEAPKPGEKDQLEKEEAALGEFEPIASPEHDDDFQETADGHHTKSKEYEAIESDEEIPDDIDIADFGQEGNVDFNLYSEDAWMSVSVSFNPYQCDLLPLQSLVVPSQSRYETILQQLEEKSEQDYTLPERTQCLWDSINNIKIMELSPQWVAGLEDLVPQLEDGLADLVYQMPDQDTLLLLVTWTLQALDINLARKQPVVVNIRQLKAGISMATALSKCGHDIPERLVNAGVIEQLCHLLEEPYMATTLKLGAFIALDSVLDSAVGMEKFLGWDLCEDEKGKQTLYMRLIEMLLTKQTPRVVTAGSALLQKVNIYKCLATLQQTVDRVASIAIPDSVKEDMQDEWKNAAWLGGCSDNDSDGDDGGNTENETAMDVDTELVKEAPSLGDPIGKLDSQEKNEKEENAVTKGKPSVVCTDEVKNQDQMKKTVTFAEPDDVSEPMDASNVVASSDVDMIIKCLANLLKLIRNASAVVQPPANTFPTKSKVAKAPPANPYQSLIRLFKSRRLMEVLLLLVSYPHLVNQDTVFAAVRDLLLYLLGFQEGLLYLASDSGTANEIIRVLTQATEDDIHYTRAPLYSELVKEDNIANCTAQCLGLLLIYYLQALQAVDLITSASKETGTICIDTDFCPEWWF
jgi:hypothetical protein